MQDLFITHPRSYRVMQERDPKYFHVNRELTSRELSQHLLGQTTISASLISNDGRAVVMGLDIDQGGLSAGLTALAAAKTLGIDAIFIRYPPADHDGGMLYARCEPSSWLRAAQLMSNVCKAAAVDAEIFPSLLPYRLPFGVHQRSHTRGILYTQDGQALDLDQPGAMQQVEVTWRGLALFPAAQMPVVEEPAAIISSHQPRCTANGRSDTIGEYNTTRSLSDVVSLLERAQARFSSVTRSGGAVLRCGCGMHQHGDKNPSLEVRPATNDQRRGWNIIGHAPNCRYYASLSRSYDPFNVLLDLHDGSVREALREARAALNNKRGPPSTQSSPGTPEGTPPAPDAPPMPTTPPAPTTPHRKSLDAYIQKHGNIGIKQLHQAFRKLGREITNERLNSEIQHRRGAAYHPDHLRKLRRDYEGIVARWDAELAQGATGENLRLPMQCMDDRTCEKKPDLSASVPPAAPVAPRRRRTAPPPVPAPSETEASFQEPKRRPLPTNPKARTMEQGRRRRERLERQSIDKLERQRAQFIGMMKRERDGSPKHRVFEAQLGEVEREIGRQRAAGLAEMYASATPLAEPVASPVVELVAAPAEASAASPCFFSQVQTSGILPPDYREISVDWDYLARLHIAGTPEARAAFERHCQMRGADLAAALARLTCAAKAGSVAVCDADATVAQGVTNFEPSIVFGSAFVDALQDVAFCERGTEAVHSFGSNAEILAGVSDSILQVTSETVAVSPEPVAASGDVGQHAAYVGLHPLVEFDSSRPAAFCERFGNVQYPSFVVKVAFPQMGNFAMPQARRLYQPEHQSQVIATGLLANVSQNPISISSTVAATRGGLAQVYIERIRDEFEGGECVPPPLVQRIREFAKAGQCIFDVAVGQSTLFHIGTNPCNVNWRQFAEQLGADFIGEPLDHCVLAAVIDRASLKR